MTLYIVYPKACAESAAMLASALKAKKQLCYGNYMLLNEKATVFNYGVGGYPSLCAKVVVNDGQAVNRCIDKLTTFDLLKKAGVSIPKYSTKSNVAAKWDTVVCRETVNGKGNEGLSYWYKGDKGSPKGQLFTEHFEHEHEWRIVVFKGVVVARYLKVRDADDKWQFQLYTKQGFKDIDSACLKASQALQIDFVGFDVLENKKGIYVVLEANSGPVMTEEVLEYIKNYFKQLKKEK